MKKLLFLSLFVSLWLSCSQNIYKRAIKYAPYDAVIVPGVPFDGTAWSDIMKMRVYWSYILYKRGITKHIIYSGGSVYTPYIEAKIMKLYALKLGIPESAIFTDSIAEHSTENLWYSYKLAHDKGLYKLALATDPFQSFAVQKFKLAHALDVRSIPVLFSEVDSLMKVEAPKINPVSAYNPDFISIEDRETKWQRFKGTLGLRVK